MAQSSNEFFSLDADGKKVDAHLHAEILDSDDGHAADLDQRRRIAADLRAKGMPEATIQELYGPL